MNTKIAALGEKDIMLIFRAVGVAVFPVNTIIEAEDKLKKIIKEEYGIIFMTETIAIKLDSIIKQYSFKLLPSIVIIPGLGERNNYAIDILRQAIIKAVGADVMAEG
jgi:V/A-type H+-transporting ATPase subunit F